MELGIVVSKEGGNSHTNLVTLEGCTFVGPWLFVNKMTPYTAILTLENGLVTLEVPGVGTDTGTLDNFTGPYNMLWIGTEGGSRFPNASVSIDYVLIERLNHCPPDDPGRPDNPGRP